MLFQTTTHAHLVGIKGVAMTSLAAILIDVGITVSGSDTPEIFVTQKQLETLGCSIQKSFTDPLPPQTDVVIYTAAHSGARNPQVVQAQQQGIPTVSQAEALAEFFNQKKGVAVCGVGGKSTISAMLAWVFTQLTLEPSYSVGVGSIAGLQNTGAWKENTDYFIAEADEYVINPGTLKPGEQYVARFSFLKPYITVCSNISYDHPDVYQDFAQTKQVFQSFFNQIHPEGCLIYKAHQQELALKTTAKNIITYGEGSGTVQYHPLNQPRKNAATISVDSATYPLELGVPGKYNLENATAVIAVCHFLKLDLSLVCKHLGTFNSTARRFQFMGEHDDKKYYDDYAHHPREIAAVVEAFNHLASDKNRVVVFQPHTYSRTKKLFKEFVESFKNAQSLVLLDIFASAREGKDASISSKMLAQAVKERFPSIEVTHLPNLETLHAFIKTLPKNSAIITLGAGDIYKLHDLNQ